MPAASLLPVTIHNGKLYFLFGKENPMEDSSKGFSDFGGGKEKESFYQTAVREASEELTGFLGNATQLKKLVKKNGGTYVYRYQPNTEREYRIHIFYLEYDPNLVESFNANHQFLWNKMDKKMLNDSKLFEKIELKWFCETELFRNTRVYRHFFVDILRELMTQKEHIRTFIQKCIQKRPCSSCGRDISTRKCIRGGVRKTRKIRGG